VLPQPDAAAYTERTMRRLLAAALPLALACATGAAAAQSGGAATAACERATRDTLRPARGPAPEVSFNAPPVVVPGSADANGVVLRGAGRVRNADGGRSFTYSCTFDSRSGEVAGVVVRDAAVERGAARAVAAAEPDLANVSPAACESAAASALKQRWPNVSRIAFNPATRALQQSSSDSADLRGQGTAMPLPGAPATHFSYRCAIDPRSGRVLATTVDD
jgi:hypothetical protein